MPALDLPPEVPFACVRKAREVPARPEAAGFVTSATHPLRVHHARAGDAPIAQEILGYAEQAWTVQVDTLGFRAPVPDDDGLLDLYLAPIGEWQAWVEPLDGDDPTALPAFVVIDQDLEAAWRASYVVHEFNHVLQFATAATEPSLNVWEATAVAAQHWTLGPEGAWDADVDSFQEAPWAPSLLGDSYTLWDAHEVGWLFEYGAALWVRHLDLQRGAPSGPALWEALAEDAGEGRSEVLRAIETASDAPLGTFLNGLARTRWLTGDRWDERGLPEAAAWTTERAVPVTAALDAADLPIALALAPAPMLTGQSFVTLDARRLRGALRATVDPGDDAHAAALLALTWPDLGEHAGWGASPEVVFDVTDVDEVVFVVTHLGAPGSDPLSPYASGVPVLSVSAERAAACACDGGSGAPGGLALPVVVVMLRRRRRRRCAIELGQARCLSIDHFSKKSG